ncbi:MAG: hypothetical protein Kow0077_24160 [Anaerolineae bacterium]
MRIRGWVFVALALSLILIAAPAYGVRAQSPRIQVFSGQINDQAEVALYDLRGLRAGDTIYAFVQATSGNLDTYLGLGTAGFERILREDDDSGGGYNSALSYTVQSDGTYRLGVTRYDDSSEGEFRLVIGLNAPNVLDGRGRPTGEPFATPAGTAARDSVPIVGLGVNFTDCTVLEARPVLSGPESTIETRYFVLHYTLTGADAVSLDYATTVAGLLDAVWKREVNEFGWPAPPNDCGEGGDTRYDVYLMDTLADSDMLGYTDPQAILGDNPASPNTETWASYSYLVIENDFEGNPEAESLMRATLAHEFHHAIQFGYDLNDVPGFGFYEATATWMETQVFPEDEDASPYVGDLFATPDLCVGTEPEEEQYSMRIYGEWLLIDSLAQDYGTRVVQRLWELIADQEGMTSLYMLAEELYTTPQQIIQRYAVRNLLRDYSVAEAITRRVNVEALADGPGEVRPRRSGVQEMAVDYVLVTQPGVYTFDIEPPNLTLTAVGISTKQAEAHVYPLGKRGTLDTTAYPYTYLVVQNTDQHTDPRECTTTDWVLTVSDARGLPPSGIEPKRWPAPNFAVTR